MFWNLGLSGSSTLDSLLNRLSSNPDLSGSSPSASPSSDGGAMESDQSRGEGGYGGGGGQTLAGSKISVEELLDEQDLLSELKGQNARLIQILASPSSISSLLHWAAYGMEDIERREKEREQSAKEELAMLRAKVRTNNAAGGESSTAVDEGVSDTSYQGDGIASDHEEGDVAEAEKSAGSDDMDVIEIGQAAEQSPGQSFGQTGNWEQIADHTAGTGNPSSKNDIFHKPLDNADLIPPPTYIARPNTPSSFIQPRDTELDRKRNYRYPQIATEILCSDVWSITEGLLNALTGPMKGYWEDVLGPADPEETAVGYEPVALGQDGKALAATSPTSSTSSSKDRLREAAAREQAYVRFLVERKHSADSLFEEDEKRRELLLGNWARITCLLMAKKPNDVMDFLRRLDGPVERMLRRIDSPPVQDVLLRLVASEEQGVSGVVELLWSQQLIPRLLDLLSPSYPPTTHATVSELIKSIIAFCAPATFNPNGGDLHAQAAQAQQLMSSPLTGSGEHSPIQGGEASKAAGQQPQDLPPRPPSPRNNIMVRELVGARSVITLVGYMINVGTAADPIAVGINIAHQADDSLLYRYDPYDSVPLPSVESQASSLVNSAIVIIELIRKNNPDFSEPSLFHTMRNRLMILQQKQAEDRPKASEGAQEEIAEPKDGTTAVPEAEDQDERDREVLEAAMREMSDNMGIVHLGLLLEVLTEQLPAFQEIVRNPRSQKGLRTPGLEKPLTHERFRIVEMYAELLHCSNMALLNRRHGTGPSYSIAGCLEGGLHGLETLGRALEGDTSPVQAEGEAAEEPEDDIQPAKELPVSQCGSADRSVSASEDDSLLQEDGEASEVLYTNSKAVENAESVATESDSALESALSAPPPPSQADAARLRDVMIQDPRLRSLTQADHGLQSETASISNVAAASALSAIGSELPPAAVDEVEAQSSYTETEPEVSGGETLKHRLIEQRVLPTMIDLFFEFPNNNFLHNVTYDVVQQILNGRLGPGLNQELIIVLFREARLVERVLDAQRLADGLLQRKGSSRPAFMGHMMLMAEEVCKFFVRCTPELLGNIEDSFVRSEWDAFVEGPLKETRLRDTRLLGGSRPPDTMQHADEGGKTDTDSSSDDDDDSSQAFAGQPLTRAASNGSAFTNKFGYGVAEYSQGRRESAQSNSSDEDSDDSGSPHLRPKYGQTSSNGGRDSLEDVFSPSSGNAQHIDDDDEAWGDFSGPSHSPGEDPFGDPFEPASSAAPFGSAFHSRPFTSIDFAERAFADDAVDWDARCDDDSPEIEMPASEGDSLDNAAAFLAANWSVPGSSAQGEVDLPPVQQATSPGASLGIDIPQTGSRRTSLGSAGSPTEARFNRPRSSSISSSSPESTRRLHPAAALANGKAMQAISPPDPALLNAASKEEPLGHGVSADTQLRDDGMLVRYVEGEEVVVPADNTVLAVHARKLSQG